MLLRHANERLDEASQPGLVIGPPGTKFSRAVRLGKICRPSGTRPIPSRAIRWVGKVRISRPANRIDPAIALVNPMIERTVVVLPMPFRPMSVTISPGATSSDMPNRTWDRP